MIIFAVVVYILIGLLVRYQYKQAHKKYKVVKRGEVWTVRDSKGRFVTCTNNYWNVARVGI